MTRLLAVAAALAAVAVLVGSRWESWALAALDPRTAFDAAATPSPPDFAQPVAWTAHPALDDLADVAPVSVRTIDQSLAPVDVFYVHPTTYLGGGWNARVDDPALNARTDELATRIQASAFNGCCAIYGPRYRQANGQALVRPGADGNSAIDVAYSDVLAAFRFQQEETGRERGFILASHSQGSALAARLLREEIATSSARERLVAAYLIGGPIDDATVPGVPVCAEPDAVGCLVAWNARGPRFERSVFDFPVARTRLCVNPLRWRHDEAPAEAVLNQGAVFLHAGDGAPVPGFADARCRDGVLLVSQIGDPPRDFMSRVLDFVIGPENYHPIEYQLYYMNLRNNAQQRVDAYLRRDAAAR